MRKNTYKNVERTAKICLNSYHTSASIYPNATREELYKMVLRSRQYTEEKIKYIMTEAKSLSDVVSLSNVVHLVVMEEMPMEYDSIVQTPPKSKYDIFEDTDLKLVETYRSLYEIVCKIIPDEI